MVIYLDVHIYPSPCLETYSIGIGYLEQIEQMIEEDKQYPKKQRHTAKRIYHRIKEIGYQGKYTQVKEAVREIKRVKTYNTYSIK